MVDLKLIFETIFINSDKWGSWSNRNNQQQEVGGER